MGLFSKEYITLMLDKYDYQPGEVIKGTVNLKLKKPTKARKFEVSFIGTKKEMQTGIGVGPGANKRDTKTIILHRFTIPLGGEQEYHEGEFPFQIKIPDNIHDVDQKLEGKVGTAVSALKAVSGIHSRIDWFVQAQLDVPMGLDVKKRQSIVLS